MTDLQTVTELSTVSLTHAVLWATFALAVAFGALMHRTQFCAMGAVADIVSFGDWTRMRMWMLAVATAMVGTNALALSGQIDPEQSIYASATALTWLSASFGGLVFGFGMVLASGCGSKTLVRLGGGSLKAAVVFAMLAIGAFATMRGIVAAPRVYGLDRVAIDLGGSQDLPSLLARHGLGTRALWRALLGCGGGALLAAWTLATREGRSLRNLAGGIGIGLLVVALWWVSGHLGYLAEDPDTLQRTFLGTAGNHLESFTFVAPLGNTLFWVLMYSDASNVLTIGIVSVFGVVAGAALNALASGRFRWEGFSGVQDTANHLIGGLLMGVGGVTALGCTIGQGITGMSTLSPDSALALAGIITGGVLGVRFQAWRLERSA